MASLDTIEDEFAKQLKNFDDRKPSEVEIKSEELTQTCKLAFRHCMSELASELNTSEHVKQYMKQNDPGKSKGVFETDTFANGLRSCFPLKDPSTCVYTFQESLHFFLRHCLLFGKLVFSDDFLSEKRQVSE